MLLENGTHWAAVARVSMSSGVKSGGEALVLLLAGSSGRGLQAGSEHTRSSSMGQLTILQSVWDGAGVGSKGRARYGGTQG